MLKILQARLQQYVKCELPDAKDGFRKGRGLEVKLPTSVGSLKKARESQKNIYYCFIDFPKAWTVWITTNCGKFFKRWDYQTDHVTCLLRNLYAGQEAIIRTGRGTTDLYDKAVYCHPDYLTYAECIT